MTTTPPRHAASAHAFPDGAATSASPDPFWARNARRYDRVTLSLNRKFPEMAAQVARDFSGRARVLEIAAGTGLVTLPLANNVRELVATDRSPQMLQVLSARLNAHYFKHVAIQVADVLNLPFASGEFDGAVVANLLHLLPGPERALLEIKRVLQPNALLAAPTFEHGASVVAQLTSRSLGLAGFAVHTRFRKRMLPALIERAGFKVERQEVFTGILPLRYVLASLPAEGTHGRSAKQTGTKGPEQ